MKKFLAFLCLLPLLSGCITVLEKEELRLEYEKLNFERAKMGLSSVELPQVLQKTIQDVGIKKENKSSTTVSYIDKVNERADDRKVMMRNRKAK